MVEVVVADVQYLQAAVLAEHVKHVVAALVRDSVAAEVEMLDAQSTINLADELHQTFDAVVVQVVAGEVKLQKLMLAKDMHDGLHAVLPQLVVAQIQAAYAGVDLEPRSEVG